MAWMGEWNGGDWSGLGLQDVSLSTYLMYGGAGTVRSK